MNRVKTISVALAAQEADTWLDVIERWIKDMDKISDTAKAAEPDIQESTLKKGLKIMENPKKGKYFTSEERDAIVNRARKVGAK